MLHNAPVTVTKENVYILVCVLSIFAQGEFGTPCANHPSTRGLTGALDRAVPSLLSQTGSLLVGGFGLGNDHNDGSRAGHTIIPSLRPLCACADPRSRLWKWSSIEP